MRCHLCSDDLEHCHEVSIQHADGATECGGDQPCGLAHLLHDWHVDCVELEPRCSCHDTDEADAAAADGAEVERHPLPLAA